MSLQKKLNQPKLFLLHFPVFSFCLDSPWISAKKQDLVFDKNDNDTLKHTLTFRDE